MYSIPAEAIKELAKIPDDHLLGAMYNVLSRQRFPGSWKRAKLVLIPKGEGTGKFRPICLLSAMIKLYESLIRGGIRKGGRTFRIPVSFRQRTFYGPDYRRGSESG